MHELSINDLWTLTDPRWATLAYSRGNVVLASDDVVGDNNWI